MSSQDSIGVVLKCMLKGAADFLVKPVRKNELRNLWQHVWRRHCVCISPLRKYVLFFFLQSIFLSVQTEIGCTGILAVGLTMKMSPQLHIKF